MFFVRTQCPHQWKSPSYRFNQRQRRAYERLITLAEREVREHDDDDDSSESSTSDGEGDEEEECNERVPEPGDAQTNPAMQPTSELQRACLSFCVELLNQTIHNREYDMALVCVLVALGISSSGRGFRSADI